jgi:hypothetical protein
MKRFVVVLESISWEKPVSYEWFDDADIAWEWAALQRRTRKLVGRIIVLETLGEVSNTGSRAVP